MCYFNVKRTIWLKGYQSGNHIEPSEVKTSAARKKHCEKLTLHRFEPVVLSVMFFVIRMNIVQWIWCQD